MSEWHEFRLCEIAKISAGGDVPKKAFSKDETPTFNVPVISNGVGNDAVYGFTNIKKISDPCITIAARGTIGYASFRDEPFYPIIRLICIVPDREMANPKFLYYQLSSMRLAGTNAGIPQLTVPMVSKYKIKLPGLGVQHKIVQILEAWEQSIDGIEQYEKTQKDLLRYLYSILLTGKKRIERTPTDFMRVKLGDVANIERGRILTAENAIAGDIPVIAGGIDSPYMHNEYTHENVITVSASGNAGYVSYRPGKIWASDCNVIYGKSGISNTLFLFGWMILLQRRIYQLRSGGVQSHVHGKDLAKLEILLPPIDVQDNIMECLSTQIRKIEYAKIYKNNIIKQKKYLLNHLISGDFDLSNIKLEKEESE